MMINNLNEREAELGVAVLRMAEHPLTRKMNSFIHFTFRPPVRQVSRVCRPATSAVVSGATKHPEQHDDVIRRLIIKEISYNHYNHLYLQCIRYQRK